MTIELITTEQYKILAEIQEKHKILTFQNSGFEYIKKSEFTPEDKEAFEQVESILREHVTGFSEFSNFCHSKDGELRIRLQYNYGAEDNSMSFTGVGYLLLKELLNGFGEQPKIIQQELDSIEKEIKTL